MGYNVHMPFIHGYTIVPRRAVISGYEVLTIRQFVDICDEYINNEYITIANYTKVVREKKQTYPYDIDGKWAAYLDEIKRECEKVISKYEYLKKLARGKVAIKEDGKFNIQKAKLVPITNIIDFDKAAKRLCIWHDEKSPSLKLNKKENYMYCFGCNKSGTAIDAVMHALGLTFREAVLYLNENFE